MEELTLEKGHPLPEWSPPRHRWKKLFELAAIGDSFIVPDIRSRESARAAARTHNVRVVSRIKDDGKIRIWVVGEGDSDVKLGEPSVHS